jgi:hypothetical protein
MNQDEEAENKLDIPDESLTEIAEHCPTLNDQERRYVYHRISGSNPVNAYRAAGYKGSSWKSVETRPKMREAIAKMVEIVEPEHRITQKTIIGILMEATEIARGRDQAHNMIAAARTLAEVTGNLAASKIEMQQKIESKTTHTHQLKMPDISKELLERFLSLDRVLPNPAKAVIEGEYEEVKR